MRVIGGTARGTRLRTLQVPHLRPMLDRVREALFNIVRPLPQGERVLDLFSGCGALGIEALSRGAESCLFVEQDARLVRLLKENLQKCRLTARAKVLGQDVLRLPLMEPPAAFAPARLVLADPPYALIDSPEGRERFFASLQQMAGRWIAKGALVVLHHRPMRQVSWPSGCLRPIECRAYGRSQLTFFEAEEALQ